MFVLLSALSLLLVGKEPSTSPQKTTLSVEIQNVRTQKGAVFIAIFKPDGSFPDGKAFDGKQVAVKGERLEATFSVEPGDYAIAVFHDANDNGKLDKGIFGIPKEPYGFSNNFRPKMSAPSFKDCQFSVSGKEKTISIAIK
ncbi:hypothetical protein GCM10028806_35630 [Spirosoma terrae]|uniref:DUF2141 domain-containing protein n=1 Tax=Spirosoma terrae TaxID=1968276 RepID=A0A6L9LAE0_9BACT|nr:DUF2141 domain-containing protein [Spirosoma terrae]NDU97486.1 DUF2141 domain-containing protein [Spirosoma terrae]